MSTDTAISDGTSTFKVPDGSDDEASDNEFDSTDDEITQANARKPPQRNTSGQGPAANGLVIDLTAAFTNRQVHEVIDLSSPCGSPISLDDDDGKHPINAAENENNGMAGEANGNYTDPELGQPVISDGMGDGIDSGTTHIPLDDESDLGPQVSMSDDEDDDYFSDDANKTSFFTDDYPDEESDSELEVYDGATSDEDMEDDSNDLDVMDSEMDSEMGPLSDDDRDMGFQDPLPGHSDYGYWGHLPQSGQDSEYPEIAPLIASLSRPAETLTATNPGEIASKGKTSCSIELLLNGDKPQSPALAPSQNTPAAESGSQESSPAKGTHTAPSCSSSATSAAEALGTMTGKVDFFIAREQNKVALSAQKAAGTRPMSSVHALCNTANSTDQPHGHAFGPAGLQSAVPPEEDQFHPRLPDVSSLFSPPADFPSARAGPGPCTSSSDFLPAMGSPVSIDQEMEFPTRMNISEIVDSHQDSRSEKPLKRKAEAISDATQEQEQWATKAAKALSPAPSGADEEEQLQPSGQHSEPMEVVTGPLEKNGEQASITPPQTPERPAKRTRMMHVAERLGYAALGGVTAGAMIVGTLIYTAPTFS
jgi:hypothetical protein